MLDTTHSIPRAVQDEAPVNLCTDYREDESGSNFNQIQADYELNEQSLVLLEAQDAVTETRPFSTAHAFIEFYATRNDRLWNRDESRHLPKDSSQPPNAFDAPCKFALIYPQSEDTCKFHHWNGYKRSVHQQRCKFNPTWTSERPQQSVPGSDQARGTWQLLRGLRLENYTS
jgi:hypothetical protein